MVHWVLEVLAKRRRLNRHRAKSKFNNPEYLLDVVWNRYRHDYPQYDFDHTAYAFCVEQIETVLKSRFNPTKLNIVATELQFAIEIQKPGFNTGSGNLESRGTIDLVYLDKPGFYHVLDYKTGKRKDWITGLPKSEEDMKKEPQFKNYLLAIKTLFPDAKHVLFTIYYTSDGGPFHFSFTPEEEEMVLHTFRQKFQQIKVNTSPTRLKDDPARWRERFKCDKVCHFGKTFGRSGRSLCDEFHSILKKDGLTKAEPKIYQISLDINTGEASRRNNFVNSKLRKGIIK